VRQRSNAELAAGPRNPRERASPTGTQKPFATWPLAQPDGGALAAVIERLLTDLRQGSRRSAQLPGDRLDQKLAPIQEFRLGGTIAVVRGYWRGSENSDETLNTSRPECYAGSSLPKPKRPALGVRPNRRHDTSMIAAVARSVHAVGPAYDARLARDVRRDGEHLQAPTPSPQSELRGDSFAS